MNLRTTTLDEVGDPDAPVGSRLWALSVLSEIRVALAKLDSDASHAGAMLKLADDHEAWVALDYPSRDMMCVKELNLNADDADRLKRAKRGQTIGELLKETPAAGDRKGGRPEKQLVRGTSLFTGNSSARLIGRLKRDHPNIIAKLEAGEFPSVRAAALAAGIVRPTAAFYTDNVKDAVRALLKHFTWDQLVQAHKEI